MPIGRSKSFDISQILNRSTKVRLTYLDSDNKVDSIRKGLNATVSGTVEVYDNVSNLPSNASAGDQAYVTSSKGLYISASGNNWYRIKTLNNAPTWDSEPESTYAVPKDGTSLIIDVSANDSDLPHVSFSIVTDSDFNTGFTITRDSDNGRKFIVTGIDSENGNAVDASGIVVFSATDGIDTINKSTTFTITYFSSQTGSVQGYSMGGYSPTPMVNYSLNAIQTFSFTSDGNAVDSADLYGASREGQGGRSSTTGYLFHSGQSSFPFKGISKFPFASGGNSTAVSNISYSFQNGYRASHKEPISDSTGTYHYTSGIYRPSPSYSYNITKKFNTSTEAESTNVPLVNINAGNYADGAGGSNSLTHGYKVATYPGIPNLNSIPMIGGSTSPTNYGAIIAKFPFAAEDSVIGVGHAYHANYMGPAPYGAYTQMTFATVTSKDNVYMVGGRGNFGGPQQSHNVMEKVPFSSDGNSTDVGNLVGTLYQHAGASSTTHGYATGGLSGPQNTTNVIQKWPFASDTNASDIGDMAVAQTRSHANTQN
tara:strand:- start:192 stop:1808 length:1617 start_codon:yes stop_codon:yes gene_type:complete